MEIFDIIDENGNPTGKTVERSIAHAEGIRHRTAHIWIIRRKNGRTEILLQKRSRNKDSFPGKFDTSSAGHIQAGDEPLESALRELKEELGIHAVPEDLQFAGKFPISFAKEFHGKMFRDEEIAFVYIYELLNLIGAESPQQAYARLKEFAAWYAGFDDRIERYAKIWLSDLAVYYGMDVSLVDKGEQADFERSVQLLTESAKHPANEIFPVLNALSSYDLTHSKLYRLYPEETEATAVQAFNLLSDYYGKHRRSGICERFFGKVYESPYVMFRSAVFYREEKHPDTEYTVDPLNVYICRSGNWINRRLFASKGRNRLLGEFIKSVDAVLRKCLSVTPELKCQPSKLYTELTTKAWQNVCGSRQKAAAANISIDTSALAGIRQNADDTLKRLLDGTEECLADAPVEADKGAYPEPDTQAPGNTAAQGVSSRKIGLPADSGESNITAADRKAAQPAQCDSEAPAETGLTELEKEYLRRVLCAEPFSELLRSESVLPSVIMDSVNEKLFDTFSDTVLIGEETAPEAVEDYTAQLYELLGLNTSEGRKA